MTSQTRATFRPHTGVRPRSAANGSSATRPDPPRSPQETPGIARIECVVHSTPDTASLDRLRHAIMSGTAESTCHDAGAGAGLVLSDAATPRGNREVGDAQSA
ncbi:MAG: hypothetical protein QOH29_246 [Actinomycetota bacterium]|nr:hypothetical protein [Actinomycetota bacterium]